MSGLSKKSLINRSTRKSRIRRRRSNRSIKRRRSNRSIKRRRSNRSIKKRSTRKSSIKRRRSNRSIKRRRSNRRRKNTRNNRRKTRKNRKQRGGADEIAYYEEPLERQISKEKLHLGDRKKWVRTKMEELTNDGEDADEAYVKVSTLITNISNVQTEINALFPGLLAFGDSMHPPLVTLIERRVQDYPSETAKNIAKEMLAGELSHYVEDAEEKSSTRQKEIERSIRTLNTLAKRNKLDFTEGFIDEQFLKKVEGKAVGEAHEEFYLLLVQIANTQALLFRKRPILKRMKSEMDTPLANLIGTRIISSPPDVRIEDIASSMLEDELTIYAAPNQQKAAPEPEPEPEPEPGPGTGGVTPTPGFFEEEFEKIMQDGRLSDLFGQTKNEFTLNDELVLRELSHLAKLGLIKLYTDYLDEDASGGQMEHGIVVRKLITRKTLLEVPAEYKEKDEYVERLKEHKVEGEDQSRRDKRMNTKITNGADKEEFLPYFNAVEGFDGSRAATAKVRVFSKQWYELPGQIMGKEGGAARGDPTSSGITEGNISEAYPTTKKGLHDAIQVSNDGTLPRPINPTDILLGVFFQEKDQSGATKAKPGAAAKKGKAKGFLFNHRLLGEMTRKTPKWGEVDTEKTELIDQLKKSRTMQSVAIFFLEPWGSSHLKELKERELRGLEDALAMARDINNDTTRLGDHVVYEYSRLQQINAVKTESLRPLSDKRSKLLSLIEGKKRNRAIFTKVQVQIFNSALMKSEHEQRLVYGFVKGGIKKKIQKMYEMVARTGGGANKVNTLALEISSSGNVKDSYKITRMHDPAVSAPLVAAESMGASRPSMKGSSAESQKPSELVRKSVIFSAKVGRNMPMSDIYRKMLCERSFLMTENKASDVLIFDVLGATEENLKIRLNSMVRPCFINPGFTLNITKRVEDKSWRDLMDEVLIPPVKIKIQARLDNATTSPGEDLTGKAVKYIGESNVFAYISDGSQHELGSKIFSGYMKMYRNNSGKDPLFIGKGEREPPEMCTYVIKQMVGIVAKQHEASYSERTNLFITGRAWKKYIEQDVRLARPIWTNDRILQEQRCLDESSTGKIIDVEIDDEHNFARLTVQNTKTKKKYVFLENEVVLVRNSVTLCTVLFSTGDKIPGDIHYTRECMLNKNDLMSIDPLREEWKTMRQIMEGAGASTVLKAELDDFEDDETKEKNRLTTESGGQVPVPKKYRGGNLVQAYLDIGNREQTEDYINSVKEHLSLTPDQHAFELRCQRANNSGVKLLSLTDKELVIYEGEGWTPDPAAALPAAPTSTPAPAAPTSTPPPAPAAAAAPTSTPPPVDTSPATASGEVDAPDVDTSADPAAASAAASDLNPVPAPAPAPAPAPVVAPGEVDAPDVDTSAGGADESLMYPTPYSFKFDIRNGVYSTGTNLTKGVEITESGLGGLDPRRLFTVYNTKEPIYQVRSDCTTRPRADVSTKSPIIFKAFDVDDLYLVKEISLIRGEGSRAETKIFLPTCEEFVQIMKGRNRLRVSLKNSVGGGSPPVSEEINVQVNDSLIIVGIPILNHSSSWLSKLIQFYTGKIANVSLARAVLDGSLLRRGIRLIGELGKAVMRYILNSEKNEVEISYPKIFQIINREDEWVNDTSAVVGPGGRRARWEYVGEDGEEVIRKALPTAEKSLANDLLMQFKSIGVGAPLPTENMFQDWKHYIKRDFIIVTEEGRTTPFPGNAVKTGISSEDCLTVMGIFLYRHMDERYLDAIIQNYADTQGSGKPVSELDSGILITCAELIEAQLINPNAQ